MEVGLVIALTSARVTMVEARLATGPWVARSTRAVRRAPSFARRTADCARHTLCGLHGHLYVRHFEPRRLSLRCYACGAETRGWSL
jgi:hypothetical protein